MKPVTYSLLFGSTIFLSAPPAVAATCADRTAVIERLEVEFEEDALANAIGASGNVFEVYGSDKLESWTILVSLPEQGLTCLIASGSGTLELQAHLDAL